MSERAKSPPDPLNEKQRSEDRFTPAQVIAAIESSGGITLAAAQKLRCHQRTVESYIRRYPDVREAQKWARAALLDMAIAGIIKAVRDGSLDACKFVAKTLGRDEGWSERVQLSTPEPLRVRVEQATIDWEKLPTETLIAIQKAAEEQGTWPAEGRPQP